MDAFRPVRRVEWESGGDDRIALLVPRFRSRYLAAWLLPLLRRPQMRVWLDARGSLVWRLCDGAHSLEEIAAEVWTRFGGDKDDWRGRVARFVRTLEKEGFVTFRV